MTNVAGLTEDAYNTAVAAAIDLVREKYPSLDLRAGTAIRALVIEPGAMLDAAQQETVNRLRTAMSLESMARETTVPRDDAEAVLSNFGISLGGGTKATGLVRVSVTSSTTTVVRAGIVFTTEDSVEFVVTETTTASVDPADGETEIVSSNDGLYYFTVPVEAVEVGANGNIQQGHSLTPSVILNNYSSAEAFADFSGGEDGESVASAVARIPSALAYRGMTNDLSVRAQLSTALGDASLLRAVSCVGYRNSAQLRDKHNPLGVAVGGRVDVYARMFDAPGVESFVSTGTLVSDVDGVGTYLVPLPSYPGFYAVKYVGPADDPVRQGSLQYDLVREDTTGATSDHDFDISSDTCEIAWSAYQGGSLLVYDSSSTSSARPSSMQFKVDLFWVDGIAGLQEIVDSASVRNVAADYVVRTPPICLVSMNAVVRLKSGVSVSASDLATKVEEYINTRSFVPRMTRSELANVLIQNGVESVDLSSGGMYLGGRICGADSKWYYLEGDSLDLTNVGGNRSMLSPDTVVFAAEPGSVQISISA